IPKSVSSRRSFCYSKKVKNTYIALLRAINVGGHTITMEALRGHFSELGLENVRTYIQTGNVFFEAEIKDRKALQEQLEAHLKNQLGYEVPVFLRTIEEYEYSLETSPFKGRERKDDVRYMVTSLASPLPADTEFPLISPKGDFE